MFTQTVQAADTERINPPVYNVIFTVSFIENTVNTKLCECTLNWAKEISLGMILKLKRTKQAPVLVRFTAM